MPIYPVPTEKNHSLWYIIVNCNDSERLQLYSKQTNTFQTITLSLDCTLMFGTYTGDGLQCILQ